MDVASFLAECHGYGIDVFLINDEPRFRVTRDGDFPKERLLRERRALDGELRQYLKGLERKHLTVEPVIEETGIVYLLAVDPGHTGRVGPSPKKTEAQIEQEVREWERELNRQWKAKPKPDISDGDVLSRLPSGKYTREEFYQTKRQIERERHGEPLTTDDCDDAGLQLQAFDSD